MELLMELLDAPAGDEAARGLFGPAGGVIGRGEDCDWVIADPRRLLSSQHARVSFSDGSFFLTDISSNGILHEDSGTPLSKGQPRAIVQGDRYRMGGLRVRANLRSRRSPQTPRGVPIPDDAFLQRDPLQALADEPLEHDLQDFAEPAVATELAAAIDEQSLPLPELIDPPVVEPCVEPPQGDFWKDYAAALDLPLDGLDTAARQRLALLAATLLRQTLRGLQQALRTRAEVKAELRLPHTTLQGSRSNPLKYAEEGELMHLLLRPATSARTLAEQNVARAFRDLQAQQVALLAASRAVLRGALEQLSPSRLAQQFEREGKTRLRTSGAHWRAYRRLHERLSEDDDWSERLLGSNFAQVYEEQIRLIASLDGGRE